jgi:hypothetical protein
LNIENLVWKNYKIQELLREICIGIIVKFEKLTNWKNFYLTYMTMNKVFRYENNTLVEILPTMTDEQIDKLNSVCITPGNYYTK